MFDDKELLEILATEVRTLRAHKIGNYIFDGLCKTITVLYNRDSINLIEKDRLLQLIRLNKPSDAIDGDYWWM